MVYERAAIPLRGVVARPYAILIGLRAPQLNITLVCLKTSFNWRYVALVVVLWRPALSRRRRWRL